MGGYVTRKAGLFLCILLASCNRDLTRESAGMAVASHLRKLAPHVLKQDSFRVEPLVILRPDANSREFQFRVTSRRAIRNAGPDSTGVMSAVFVSSDAGWSLSKYGPTLVPFVSQLVAVEHYMHFAPLLDALSTVRRSAADAQQKQMDLALAAIRSGDYSKGSGLRVSMAALGEALPHAAVPDSLKWGLNDAGGSETEVIWVASARDTTKACAEQFGSGDKPLHFFWVDGLSPTCRERGMDGYVFLSDADSVAARIARSGGLLAN